MIPDDFVQFVTIHGPRVARACAEIAGNDQVAEALRTELFAGVAGRWSRWPAGSRVERALVRIEQRLHREAQSQPVAVPAEALDLRSALRLRPSAEWTGPDEESVRIAGAAWSRATKARRRRWTGLAVAGVAVLVAVLLVPPAPPPLPGEVPEGVTVLPAVADLMAMREEWPWGGLPPHLLLRSSDVDGLASLARAPLHYAMMVASTSDGGLALAGYGMDDGTSAVRLLDGSRLRGARLVAASLSPDGTVVALPSDGDLVLVDVRTGGVRRITVGAAQPEVPVLTWLDSRRIIVPGPQGALAVDVTTDEVASVAIDSSDVLTLRGYITPRLTQLVAVPANPDANEGPHTPRSLLLYWRSRDATGAVETAAGAGQVGVRRIITGPPWLGAWVGPGWAAPELVVRACAPTGLLLPAQVGSASAAVAALDTNGKPVATLVATGDTRLDALGVIPPEPNQPIWALVAVRTDDRSLIVGWDPVTGAVVTLTRVNVDTQVSVADLIGPRCPWCPGPPVAS